jgi:NADPH:quinone reductase-like Zn-dependent oxidoreductase
MKAIVYERYGSPDVLQLKEIEKPIPTEDRVLVKVRAASVNAFDWHMMRGKPFLVRLSEGLLKPKNQVLGGDIAGVVEAVGSEVKEFKPGDEVFGTVSKGFAEYACPRERYLALKPTNLSFDEAAAVPMAALTALQGLRDKGRIQPGQKVLIDGASGGVGTFAVQIAKSFGAEVTGVCGTKHLDKARSIGADHVIDYTQEDFTRNGQLYDLILSANGRHSLSAYKRALGPTGNFVMTGGPMIALFQTMLLGRWMSKEGGKKMGFMMAKLKQNDLAFLRELLEAGKIAPVIERRYPLSQVADAIRYLEEGHAQGKLVITLEE